MVACWKSLLLFQVWELMKKVPWLVARVGIAMIFPSIPQGLKPLAGGEVYGIRSASLRTGSEVVPLRGFVA